MKERKKTVESVCYLALILAYAIISVTYLVMFFTHFEGAPAVDSQAPDGAEQATAE